LLVSLKNPLSLSLFLILALVFSPLSVLAVNPPQPFSPSDNILDPNCLPTDSNCYVAINNLSLTSATATNLTTTSAVTSNFSVLANAVLGGDISFSGATSTITDNVITSVATATGAWGTWNDGTKWSIVSPVDGFVRFVYQDNNMQNLNFVRCLDQDCITKVSTIIATSSAIDFPQLTLGPDGFARVSYVTDPSSVNRLYFIKCLNDDCSSNTNTLVVTATSSSPYFYEHSIAVGPDGLAHLVYYNYGGTDDRVLHLVNCTNSSCSTSSVLTVASTTNVSGNGFYPSIAVGSDNIVHIAYNKYTSSSGEIYVASCIDTNCSSLTTNMLEADTGWWYTTLSLTSNNLPRIAWEAKVSGNSVLRYASCSDTLCASKTLTTIDSTFGTHNVSMVLDSNNLARMAYGNSQNIRYVQCLNDSCSIKNNNLITSGYGYNISIALNEGDLARILFRSDSSGTGIKMARLVADDGEVVVAGQSIGSFTRALGDLFTTRVTTNLLTASGGLTVGAADSPLFSVLQNGNVGIGTANPTASLNIQGTSSMIVLNGTASTSQPGIQMLNDSGKSLYTWLAGSGAGWMPNRAVTFAPALTFVADGNSGAGNIWFLANNYNGWSSIPKMVINGDGNVGIGSTTPLARLSVVGSGTGTGKAFSLTDSSNVEKFTILDNGKVGIGTSSPDYTLSVGNASITGVVARFQNSTGYCDINPTTTSLTCTSDIRLKKNIVTLDASTTLATLTQLNPVTYNWLAEDNASSTHAGFIAQEVKPLFPDLVSTDANGTLSVAYSGFIPYIVQSIKEIAHTIASFKERIVTGEVTTATLCVGVENNKTCISKEKLDALLQGSSNDSHNNSQTIALPSTTEVMSTSTVGLENATTTDGVASTTGGGQNEAVTADAGITTVMATTTAESPSTVQGGSGDVATTTETVVLP
jgi:hypothetical protein